MKKETPNTPKHAGIIIDGNRRWARERNLPTVDGHNYGYRKMLEAPGWFFDRGIKTVSVYVFSTENWNRGSTEVAYLMRMISDAFGEEENLEKLDKRGYKLLISGWTDDPRLPGDLPEILARAEQRSRNNTRGTLNLCFNYGGWTEIVSTVAKILEKNIGAEQVHEGLVRKYMYHAELGDLDLLIRSGGEKRLSGFMPLQSAYAELFFLDKYWPDFEETDVDLIMSVYANRQRRMGGD